MGKQKNARFIQEEMLSSEEKYADFLRIARDKFQPCCETLLSSEKCKAIFINISQIIALCEEFISDLRHAVSQDVVGKLYLELSPYFGMYGEYTRNHAESIDILVKETERNRVFQQALCKMEEEAGNTLLSLLVMPVQRVPRHVLMLTELSGALPKRHPDFRSCKEALAQMRKIAKAVDNSIYEKERRVKVWEIQQSIRYKRALLEKQTDQDSLDSWPSGTSNQALFCEPNRYFVYEGELVRISDCSKKEQRMVFLFNDCMLSVRPASKAARVRFDGRRWVFCECLRFVEVLSLDSQSPLALGVDGAFLVKSETESVVWLADSCHAKDEWVSMIESEIRLRENALKSFQNYASDGSNIFFLFAKAVLSNIIAGISISLKAINVLSENFRGLNSNKNLPADCQGGIKQACNEMNEKDSNKDSKSGSHPHDNQSVAAQVLEYMTSTFELLKIIWRLSRSAFGRLAIIMGDTRNFLRRLAEEKPKMLQLRLRKNLGYFAQSIGQVFNFNFLKDFSSFIIVETARSMEGTLQFVLNGGVFIVLASIRFLVLFVKRR